MFKKLDAVEKRYNEVERKLQDGSLTPAELRKLSKEHSDLQTLVNCYQEHKKTEADLASAKALLEDSDESMRAAAKEEINALVPKIEALAKELNFLLLPKDPNDDKNVILEVRAGAGGDEAALFCAEAYRMYQRYAEKRGWRVELLGANQNGIGGIKEVSALISGDKVFSRLKNEAGVHRVQRVPATEAQGRIHTSTITVAVLPEAEEVDIQIRSEDLKIEVYRSGGAGGQSVNTTDSAVRITHLPTGTVVAMQDERSQLKNKERAMKVLRSRIYEAERARKEAEYAANRRSMVGTGDRSERIRTYNFPQSRMTDHRIGFTSHALTEIMNGALDDVMDALITQQQAEQLKNANDIL